MQKPAEKKPTRLDRHIGKRVRKRRRERGSSLRALSAKVGVCYQLLSSYENGKTRMSAARLYDIARELDVTMDYFFDDFVT